MASELEVHPNQLPKWKKEVGRKRGQTGKPSEFAWRINHQNSCDGGRARLSLRFELTSGQDHDSVTGYRFLQELDYYPSEVLADRAYDTNAILEHLQSRAITAVIPSKRNLRVKRLLDSETYKEHHLIECIFNKVKKYRRLATRYEKTANMFIAFLTLLSIRLWLK
ncbi:transposase [Paenibacillus sp. RC67]|uniref:transposase n=1 Tax=Paenibacillus sp. RC67 TaxID=3039392 RepID=UPI0024AE12D1|nr:transposase [Paenibacillus sp. RC67]